MKLAILGGGGFRVPLVYGALLRDGGSPRVTEVSLYDTDARRLAVIESVLAQQAEAQQAECQQGAGHESDEWPDPPRVRTTTDLDAALEGSRFVFSAIRVGGLRGRTVDERVALRLGVLGQETTGAGGVAYGLRTVPVAHRIAGRVAAVAPDAYVINFTNPAGMVTEAMQRILGDRVVGICDSPSGLGRRVAGQLGLDPERLRFDYVGLNHLGWMRRVLQGGRDRLPDLLADDDALGRLEEGRIFGVPWLRALGAIPNEYLYYYDLTRDAIAAIASQTDTRGEFLARQQDAFYAAAAADPGSALARWHATIAEREALYMAEARGPDTQDSDTRDARDSGDHGGYEDVALAVMAAIARDERSTLIVNVRNGSTLAGLDAEAVVEVPSLVDAGGVHPLATAAPEPYQLGLMQRVKAVERLVIEAATTGSSEAALKAFALHPLVDSVTVARDLLAAYLDALPELARLLGPLPPPTLAPTRTPTWAHLHKPADRAT